MFTKQHINVFVAEGDNDTTFDGLTQDSIYAWGLQVEASPVATSYIPTTTTSATRNADVLEYAGSDGVDYSSTGGTIVGEATMGDYDIPGSGAGQYPTIAALYLNAGTRFSLFFEDTNDSISSFGSNGAAQWSIVPTTDYADATRRSYVLSFALNDIEIYAGGTSEGTDTVATIPTTIDTIGIGNDGNSTYQFTGGVIHRVRIFPQLRVIQ